MQDIELIDTLWNVNPFAGSIFNANVLELIDTLWNVNADFLTPAGFSKVN